MNQDQYNILHGDCLQLMNSIPDKTIDCVICDPPYGTTPITWDQVLPFEKLWEQYDRIVKQIEYNDDVLIGGNADNGCSLAVW